MKTLPTQFTEKGFTHRQLAREGCIALFERIAVKREGFTQDAPPHFEVVVIGSHNGYEIKTATPPVKVGPGEMYPTAAQWGKTGWTFTDIERAKFKFAALFLHESAPA